jgi:hypothetical protein
MIRVGDKVAPFFNMVQVGTVILIETTAARTYTEGGTQSGIAIAHIRLDKQETVVKYKVEDLLRADM